MFIETHSQAIGKGWIQTPAFLLVVHTILRCQVDWLHASCSLRMDRAPMLNQLFNDKNMPSGGCQMQRSTLLPTVCNSAAKFTSSRNATCALTYLWIEHIKIYTFLQKAFNACDVAVQR